MKLYEYSYVPDDVDPWLRDEAIDFGEVYATNMAEAKNLAWAKIPYNCIILNVKEVR